MASLHAQVVGKLAASLEGTIGVATVICSLMSMLVRSMTALDTEIVSELAAGLEGAIGVALEVVSKLAAHEEVRH